MASIHLKGRSRLFHAYFKAWDASAEKWKLVSRATGTADRVEAQRIADQYERVAKMAGPGGVADDGDLRRRTFEVLRSIVELSGRSLSPRWTTFAEEWLELRSRKVKLSTRQAYKSHLGNFSGWLVKRGLEELRVAEVSLALAQAYYDALLADGASTRTAKGNLVTISQVMDRAVAMRLATDNPIPQVERAVGMAREREPFTLEEVGRLLKACGDVVRPAERVRDWRTMILIGLCTGARIGDCARMTWEMVEWVGGREVLAWRPGKKMRVSGGGKVVRVPLVDPLSSWMRGLGFSSGPLCPVLYDEPVGNRSGLSAQFGEIVDASGIAMVVCEGRGSRGKVFRSKTFHSLRHTLNSLLFAADVPQEWRMRVLDHDSAAVNEGYTHTDVLEMARWMEKVDLGRVLE